MVKVKTPYGKHLTATIPMLDEDPLEWSVYTVGISQDKAIQGFYQNAKKVGVAISIITYDCSIMVKFRSEDDQSIFLMHYGEA